MAVFEARLNVGPGARPRARVHRDGRRCEIRAEAEGVAFLVSGDPLLVRRWLVVALAELDHEIGVLHG